MNRSTLIAAVVVVAAGAGYLWWRRRPTVDADGHLSCPEGQAVYQDHRGDAVTFTCKPIPTGERPEYVMGENGQVTPYAGGAGVFDPANYVLEPGPPPYYRRRRAGEGLISLLEAQVPTRDPATPATPALRPLPGADLAPSRSPYA